MRFFGKSTGIDICIEVIDEQRQDARDVPFTAKALVCIKCGAFYGKDLHIRNEGQLRSHLESHRGFDPEKVDDLVKIVNTPHVYVQK